MNAEKEKLLPLAKEDFIHPALADIYQEEIKWNHLWKKS